MEGYLHKKGHALPIMQRRYCVLKGTMLAYYTDQDEYARQLTPRNVLEVVGVNDLDETRSSSSGWLSPSRRGKAHAFEIAYLGGTTYQCRADSHEDKLQWLSALQHAMDEPNRIVQDEIDDAQRHLQEEAERHEAAMALASDAVAQAQQVADEALAVEAETKQNHSERTELDERLRQARILLVAAQKTTAQTRLALERARSKAHDAALATEEGENEEEEEEEKEGERKGEDDSSSSAIATRVAHLAAQLEVDRTLEATQLQQIAAVDELLVQNARQRDELQARAKRCAAHGHRLREAAASSLQSAQSAQQLSRLRVSSWTASSSHLDPLAEGYLLCKHPVKPSMHRRYYVLYGNTLCWYKDVDDYTQHVEAPSGVVHVSAVAEWTGKVGGMKTFPHAFAVATVEGKTLHCSAPLKQSAVTWETALHIGLTMPALSPHRAMQAKARRNSFDLLSMSSGHAHQPGAMPRRPLLAHMHLSPRQETTTPPAKAEAEAEAEAEAKAEAGAGAGAPLSSLVSVSPSTAVVVEGYLVKKSSLFPVMKKKYCVLHGLRLSIFDSHDLAQSQSLSASKQASHEDVLVCGVSEWDGHGALLQYHYGFQLHTVRHQSIQCSAANDNEKAKWLAGVHEALLRFKGQLLSPVATEEQRLEQKRSAIRAVVEQSAERATSGASSPSSVANQFRIKIQQVYMEHHPEKAHDVPMLVDKYAGREHTLVVHLDRLYGTALAQDPEVKLLVESLKKSSVAKSPRGRRRLSSGVTSGLREFGKITGYLHWTPPSPSIQKPGSMASFSVLAMDKLLRYASETAYLTEPYNPLEVIQLVSVQDLPASSPTGFCVGYRRAEAETKAPSRPSSPVSPSGERLTLQLEAPTEELRTLWMAKIRSGLGIAETATQPAAALTGTETGGGGDYAKAFRRNLVDYYRQNNPRRIAEVDTLLHYFAGRERLLLADLDATYGTSISTDDAFVSLLRPSPAGSSAGVPSSASADGKIRYESYLLVKHPQLGSAFQRKYCVLHDTHWSCFATSRDAHAFGNGQPCDTTSLIQPTPPLLADTVVSLNYLNAKLHEMRVFSLEGHASGAILLRADVEPLFQDWTRKLRQAADLQLQQLNAAPASSVSTEDMPPWWHELHRKLVAFYQQQHPQKVRDVASLLHAFHGRERALLEEIDKIHHTELATDPTYLSLLPDGATADDSADSELDPATTAVADPETAAILMEGYLIKRGHLVPSMRKRYCVLVKNVLTYFLTHEDSRNAEAQPQGSFRVEIVSDWHGKTTTQSFEHGIELETHDGKTFFCAACSSYDKSQWMRAFHHGIAIVRAETVASLATPSTATAAATTTGDGTLTEETEPDKLKRDRFRARLVQYYQQYNPRKLADLDLLLACYKGRELAMLEAMDATYGSQLLHDEALLALLPPLSAHTQALRSLEYDGPLERAAGGNSEAAWKIAQRVYVAQSALTLTFYASREGFKAGAAALASAADRAVTVLAVKPVDNPRRFAVETTDHQWMYFQAPNVLEKAHWLQLLQAALDAMLAKTILDEEKQFLTDHDAASLSSERALMKGFLIVRMDFSQALAEFQTQLRRLTDASSSPSPSCPSSASNHEATATSSVMKECFVVLQRHNQLSLFAEDGDRTQPTATLTALSTRAWKAVGGAAPRSNDSSRVGRFPFQVLTQEQVVLSCGAATDLDRATWIQQIRKGAQQAAALEMLQAQLDDVQQQHESMTARPARRASVVDESTGDMRGYLFYQLRSPPAKGSDTDTEGFLVVSTRGEVQIYVDESAFLRAERPLVQARAIEIMLEQATSSNPTGGGGVGGLSKILTGWGSSPRAPARYEFGVKLVIDDDGQSTSREIAFFPASADEKQLWISALTAGVNTRKGEQLLADECAVLAIESLAFEQATSETEQEMEAFVWATSAMEGALVPWRSGGSAAANGSVFAVLSGCGLRVFPSRAAAVTNANANAAVAAAHAVVASISEWVPPPTTLTAAATQDASTSTGFQLLGSTEHGASAVPFYFTAPTLRDKQRWVHAVQHELDFALAEQYLDEDAKEFARLAAAHVVASCAISAGSSADAGLPSPRPAVRLEGYVRVRHQFVAAMWRERFALVVGSALWLFRDGGDACADDWQRLALEQHELLAAHAWQPREASQLRHGIRLENQTGTTLELVFASLDDRETWLAGLTTALTRTQRELGNQANDGAAAGVSPRFASRDAALPFVPGAAMEGYVKVRDRPRTKFSLRALVMHWTTRYAVLIGTQWLLYETQQQALALHGHNQQVDTSEQRHDEDVLPRAVLDVVLAEPWPPSRDRKKRAKDSANANDNLETHGFVVVANKSSAFTAVSPCPQDGPTKATAGDVVECKAQTSLERKRWLNAVEDQLASAAKEQEMVRQAMAQHSDKQAAQQEVKNKFQALREDANRRSIFLHDVLASLATEPSTSEDEEEDEDEEEEEEEEEGEDGELGKNRELRPALSIRTRSVGRVHSPENSPMYRLSCTDVQSGQGSQGGDAFAYEALGSPSKAPRQAHSSPWWSLPSLFTCCFDRPPAVSASAFAATIRPLEHPHYEYEFFHEDKPSRLEDL